MSDTPASTPDFSTATALFERMLMRLRAVEHFAVGRRVLTIVALAYLSPVTRFVLKGLANSRYDPTAAQSVRKVFIDAAAELEVEFSDVFVSVLIPDVLQSRWEQSAAYAGDIISALPFTTVQTDFGVWFSDRLDQIVNAGPTATEVGTPQPLASFITDLADLQPGLTTYDPCCGIGGLLAEAWRSGNQVKLVGSEVHPISVAIARLRLSLLGAIAQIKREDALHDPDAQTYDRILCDPPLGHYVADRGELRAERNRAAHGGLRRMDALFLERSVNSLAEGGRAVILVSQGILSRRGADAELRRRLISERLVEAIIALPSGAVSWSSAELAILVLSRVRERYSAKILDGASVRLGRAARPAEVYASLRAAYAEPDESVCRDVPYDALMLSDSLLPRRFVSTPVERRAPDQLRDEGMLLIAQASARLPYITELFSMVLDDDK